MQKVLFINASLGGGGSERVMCRLANHFVLSGLKIEMILIREKERAYSLDERIQITQLNYRSKQKELMILQRLWKMRKMIQKSHADVVLSFMTDVNIFTLLACLGLHQTVIISERAHPDQGHGESKWYRFLRNCLYTRATNIVFQTEQAASYFPAAIQKKGVVITNPISDEIPKPWEGERERVIVAAGRMTAQKNFAMLLRAFAAFQEKHSAYHLVIFGEGPKELELKRLAKTLGIEHSVSFPGFVSDVNLSMQKAQMYVSTSNFEGISNSMLEALAMGIPSICTDCPVGGAAKIIVNRENGILVPVGAEQALVAAMDEIASKPKLAQMLGEKAKETRKQYSIDKIGKQWTMLFRNVEGKLKNEKGQ